jgi:hypothetical protein
MTAEEFGASAAAKYADALRMPANSDERSLLESAFAHAFQSGYVAGVDAAGTAILSRFGSKATANNG